MSLARQTKKTTPPVVTRTSKESKAKPPVLPKRGARRHRATQAAPQAATLPETQAAAVEQPSEAWAYGLDFYQRTVLFYEALRRRANNMLEHERAGLPPLLDFKYETVLDARSFEQPANYALLRIIEVGEDCWEDCVDPDKPPVIVIDPRAGHGPGIGGFKHDSEVGMALHEGHPVYFVIFFPEPEPNQTLADVHNALRRFVKEVARRHQNKAPVLYGNCQAGWAATLLASDCEGLAGPVVLNGSPLSYWAGEAGVNPMRVAGGLLGGAWLSHFTADLGGGRFDGAWLAQNFENLKPEKAIWEKYANLFHAVDSEEERFLEFERWWNGFYFLSREEIVAIVENLFIGNKLERGELRIDDDCVVDLRRIRNPLIIFASYGDNITPPHQALGWIPAVYKDTEDLKAAGQRIVYLTNPHVGHLGIFVSAKVARLEHRAILESLEEIEALAPGLYEMQINNPSGDPDCHKPQFSVAFEERRIEDLNIPQQSEAFERVRAVSETGEAFYRTFVSPWVQAATNPWIAESLKWLHPMRSSRYLFSEAFNPWMRGVAVMADVVAKNRTALAKDHPLLEKEEQFIEEVSKALESTRMARDEGYEQIFGLLYGLSGKPSVTE
ncbi:DUF3141 domain-containing protein [Limibacillus sp. MBR-115]|uniref:DUF3141 domain-containing protein n=1 Tax=Limibacillus sp. MBR-115 TaxID=3156465 RepID=UPI0033947747